MAKQVNDGKYNNKIIFIADSATIKHITRKGSHLLNFEKCKERKIKSANKNKNTTVKKYTRGFKCNKLIRSTSRTNPGIEDR